MTGIVNNEPEYSLEEDDNFIKVTIPAPLSRPGSAAVVLEKNVLTFDTPPYLLRLKLPSKVIDDYSDVNFNGQSGIYTVKLKKDLSGNANLTEEDEEEEDCEEYKLVLEELRNEKANEKNETGNQFYGFGNLYSNMFGQHYDEFSDVFDVPNPDKTEPKERTILRKKEEKQKWNADHYLADKMESDDSDLENYLNFNPFWERTPLSDDLSNDEKDTLDNLTKKDWMKSGLSDESRRICELQMIDVLFAYAYNKRITEGDNSVTSAWNITKLSATLSWFEVFENVTEVLVSCYKRCITYPLCRSWLLVETVHQDVIKILSLGPKIVTKCFLEVRDIFNETDNYYVLNTLYINDLAHFAYNLDKERTVELSKQVDINIKKKALNLDLDRLEMAAWLVLSEEEKNLDEDEMKRLVMKKFCKMGFAKFFRSRRDGSESSDSESNEESSYTEESGGAPEGDESSSEESDESEEEESSDEDSNDDEGEEEEDWESCEEEEVDEEEDDEEGNNSS